MFADCASFENRYGQRRVVIRYDSSFFSRQLLSLGTTRVSHNEFSESDMAF